MLTSLLVWGRAVGRAGIDGSDGSVRGVWRTVQPGPRGRSGVGPTC